MSSGWTISSTYPIGGDASLAWDNFCTGCEADIVPLGALIGGTVSWTPDFGPDAKGTVYGVEFPSYADEDEYGTLWLLPQLMFTLDPFYIPHNYTGEPETLRTTFKVSGALEGRDFRTDRSFVFRDAVTGYGRATFVFSGHEEPGFLFAIADLAFDPTEFAPVPEPTSILLSITGLAAIGHRAWRHRRA